MPFITSDDISFVFSGGSSNASANLSLGGNPSNVPISGSINNLFNDIETEEAEDGLIDYRCFYVFNDSASSSIFDVKAFFTSLISGGASVQMGVSTSTEVQKLTVTGGVTGGSATLSYEDQQFTWNYDPTASVWANNLQTALNNLSNLSDVTVQHTQTDSTDIFVVTFEGANDNRYHDLIVVVSDDFTPGGSILSTRVTEGAPVNSIAPKVAARTVAPAGVTFILPISSFPIEIGTLYPGDGFPIWVKRTTDPDTLPMQGDGFTFALTGKPF